MTTTSEAPETWRVECEGGEVREVPVRSRAVLLGGRVQTLYEAGEGDASVERLTARAAVVGLASFEGWPVVAVLAPGQPTCAEVDAAHVRAANARDQLRLRCEELEAERDALRSLLAAAARGELPRCDECPHAATLYAATTAGEFHRCDAHVGRRRVGDAAACRRAAGRDGRCEVSGEEARLRAELAATEAEARAALDEMHRRVEVAEAEVAMWRGDETVANLVALRAAVQRHREAVEREQDEATTRAELFAVADECHALALTVREPATRAERDRDLLARMHGAALVCLAAERAYHATEGRPWAERIAAKRRADEARAVLARMMGGG